jgi:hypothetical protein
MSDYEALFEDEVMVEVRERKAHVAEKYGGWEGLMKHMDEDRPRLEKAGWKFVTVEEVRRRSNVLSRN